MNGDTKRLESEKSSFGIRGGESGGNSMPPRAEVRKHVTNKTQGMIEIFESSVPIHI